MKVHIEWDERYPDGYVSHWDEDMMKESKYYQGLKWVDMAEEDYEFIKGAQAVYNKAQDLMEEYDKKTK